MDLKSLWKQRRAGFWNGILPYLGYVIQSGVAMVFLFLVIAFSAWYTSFVQNIPAEFPIRWIALLPLAPLVLFSSYRTYLLPADIVFLRPQEYRMQEYLKNSFARGVIYKSLGLLLVFVTLWPLYVRADLDARPFGWFIVFLLLWKGLSSYGAWQELRMVQVGAARGYRLLRWALAVLAVGAWLWRPPRPRRLVPALAGSRLHRRLAYTGETSGSVGTTDSGRAGAGWQGYADARLVRGCTFIRTESKFASLA